MSAEDDRRPSPALTERLAFLARASRSSRPIPDDPALAAAAAVLVAPGRLSPADAVEIYRRQYWARHMDALEDDLPGLRALLGGEAFDAFGRGYLERFPPRSPALGHLSRSADAYADAYPGFPPGLAALCRDLVRYELAVLDAFGAPEAPPDPPGALARAIQGDFGRARLRICPSLRLLALAHRAHDVRLAARAHPGFHAAAEAARRAAEGAARPVWLAVHRDPETMVVGCLELASDAHALLGALASGSTVEAACELAFSGGGSRGGSREDDAGEEAKLAERVEGLFHSWSALGIISGIMPSDPERELEPHAPSSSTRGAP